jgi:hypothetical protein
VVVRCLRRHGNDALLAAVECDEDVDNGLSPGARQVCHGVHYDVGEHVMHVKCMHKLCSLLTHICNIYDVISIFYIEFWGFTNDPLYLGYNSARQENPVLSIF